MSEASMSAEDVAYLFGQSSAWHPIETAPKDGTIVLGWEPRASKWKIKFMVYHRTRDGGYWTNAVNTGSVEATHWMPLPAPPSEPYQEWD